MTECVFCKVAAKELESDIVYEDPHVIAIRDINPQAPIHIVVIPKRHIVNITEVKDFSIFDGIFKAISKIALQEKIAKNGFRVVINQGEAAGQTVPHLHFHIIAGRDLSWPPG